MKRENIYICIVKDVQTKTIDNVTSKYTLKGKKKKI